jgi:trk system potassium uptake protein TrkH
MKSVGDRLGLGITEVRLRAQLLRLLPILAAAVGVILQRGFDQPVLSLPWLHGSQAVLMGWYMADLVVRQRRGTQPIPGQHLGPAWAFMLAATIAGFVWNLISPGPTPIGDSGATAWGHGGQGWWLFEIGVCALALGELWRLNFALSRRLRRPGVLLPLSFATLIAAGTCLLKLPVATPGDQPLSWLDALFTITSAVCVTGLAIRNTAHGFTPFGQIIIATFIQLGGLGIIIFGSMVAMLLGSRLSLWESKSLSEMLNDQPVHRVGAFVRFIVVVTLLCELVGAAASYPFWEGENGGMLTVHQRIGMSLFHSVSAFCNAGFDITGSSLEPYRFSVLTHIIIAGLIVVGGLGFPVQYNLGRVFMHRLRQRLGLRRSPNLNPASLVSTRLNLHTKLVLATTLGLYLYGLVFIGVGQLVPYLHDYAHPTTSARAQDELTVAAAGRIALDAHFMSITARTAGYNSMPMDQISPAGVFTLMSLMLVGGSPGGTAGGVKTTTLALVILSIVATVRQRPETEAFQRSIADALIRRAATLGAALLAMIGFGTLLLTLTEPFEFTHLLFEAISAATTTGLSLGITADLTPFGKGVVIALMFLGRVGPLALLGALAFAKNLEKPYKYPHEEVVLG